MADMQMAILAWGQSSGGGLNYFDTLVWPGGGTIGLIIWGLSIVMVALGIQFFITIRRGTLVPDLVRQQIQTMFDNKQYREAIEMTAAEPSLLSYVVHAAMKEAAHGYAAMERAMEEAAEDRATKLMRRIDWLNLLGNIAPMLGLLGTVWGMILAFMEIVQAKAMPSPDKLAYAIGIALVTTLLGLSVAIPSLGMYAVLRSRIDELVGDSMLISEELLAAFRPAAKTAASAA